MQRAEDHATHKPFVVLTWGRRYAEYEAQHVQHDKGRSDGNSHGDAFLNWQSLERSTEDTYVKAMEQV